MNRPARIDGPSAASLAAAAVLLASASLRCVWGADFWWQYKTGEYVAQHGPPRTDVFSYTARGEPWIEPRWLYCWLLFQGVRLGGLPAVVLAKTALIGAAFWLAFAAARTRGSTVSSAALLAAAVLAANERFFVRPEGLTWFFFALFLYLIARFRQTGSRTIYLLPLLQTIWVNSHPLFALGPALVGMALAAAEIRRARGCGSDRRQIRPLAVVLAGCAAACLVNPWGWRGAVLPLQLFAQIRGTVFKEYITELQSPLSSPLLTPAQTALLALVAVAALSAALNARRLDGFLLLVVLSQAYLAILALRNVPLFCLAVCPFVSRNFAEAPLRARGVVVRALPGVRRAGAVIVFAGALFLARDFVTDRSHVRRGDTNQFGWSLAAHHYPADAEAFLGQERLAEPIFSTMAESAWLLACGRKVFIDPRLEVHGEDAFRRYTRIIEEPAAWRRASDEFGFRAALVDVQSRIVNTLGADPDWRLVYFDAVAAVFARADSLGNARPIVTPAEARRQLAKVRESLHVPRAWNRLRWFDRAVSPVPYHRLGVLLMALGFFDEAEPFLRDALAAYPHTAGVHRLLGRILEQRGDLAHAQREYEAEQRLSPRDPVTLLHRALIHARLGQWVQAESLARACLEREPSAAPAWFVLGGAQASAGRMEEAAASALRAVALEPSNTEYRFLFGRLESARGRFESAVAELRRVVADRPQDAAALAELAAALAGGGQEAEAQDCVERGLARWPNDAQLRALQSRLRDAPR